MKSLINYKALILASAFIVINLVYDNAVSQDDTLQSLQIGDKIIQVEVPGTEEKVKHGLMYREDLPENQGMLFVFPSEEFLYFWMKDTYIPLSIGFFNAERELLEVQEMYPDNALVVTPKRRIYASSHPCKYALEMNRRWFLKNKIELGTKFKVQ